MNVPLHGLCISICFLFVFTFTFLRYRLEGRLAVSHDSSVFDLLRRPWIALNIAMLFHVFHSHQHVWGLHVLTSIYVGLFIVLTAVLVTGRQHLREVSTRFSWWPIVLAIFSMLIGHQVSSLEKYLAPAFSHLYNCFVSWWLINARTLSVLHEHPLGFQNTLAHSGACLFTF